MIIVCILLWILAFIIIIKDYKTESTRWMAAIAFLTGLGAFSVVFEDNIIKYFINENGADSKIIKLMYSSNGILAAMVHCLAPYCMLIYGMSYLNIISKSKKRIIYIVLFIPAIISFIILPVKSNSLKTPEELMLYFRQLTLWTVPYMIAAIYLLVYSYVKEKSYLIKKYKFGVIY